MSDSITLTGLRVFAHHGVLDSEKKNGQDFVIDVELALDLRASASEDDLAQTVNYGVVADQVHDLVATGSVDLIETVAEKVAGAVLEHADVLHTTITVHKPQAPITVPFDDVAVTIHRDRNWLNQRRKATSA